MIGGPLIAYKEFRTNTSGFATAERRLEIQALTLAEVNEWIDSESIDVINVESIAEDFLQPVCFRVWYRTTSLKAHTSPEV